MSESYNEAEKRAVLDNARTLVKCIEKDAPDIMLCKILENLITHGLNLVGPNILENVLKKAMTLSRRESGFCQFCDGDPDPVIPGKLHCSSCTFKAQKMLDDLE